MPSRTGNIPFTSHKPVSGQSINFDSSVTTSACQKTVQPVTVKLSGNAMDAAWLCRLIETGYSDIRGRDKTAMRCLMNAYQ